MGVFEPSGIEGPAVGCRPVPGTGIHNIWTAPARVGGVRFDHVRLVPARGEEDTRDLF